ncbi:MAG TPA: flagellin, partial [Sporichthya sp.]|nr:flagellin [Sporichthya sp.]
MGLRINQNISAMNAYRNLSVTSGQMEKSLERLSSGFRINRAADDASGLSISEGLRSQIGGLKVAVRNSQDAISVVQTAEGALTETTSILQRMRDLAVQAANGGSQDAKAQAAAQTEFSQLQGELDRIAKTTSFGGQKLLDVGVSGSTGYSGNFQVGANNTANDQINVALNATAFGTAVTSAAATAGTISGTGGVAQTGGGN